ncbi:MAG: bifunctional glutamate N-acetyltransferase/amino-acid acetyltransferase ArgJ [Alphaproteobacteria bacterium]
MSKRSPLAPASLPDILPVKGVRLAALECNIRYKGRPDLFLAELAPDTAIAGVFTNSLCPSAAVDLCRKNLPYGKARAIVVNSGNANAFTGQVGAESVDAIIAATAKTFDCDPREVFHSSTGVIGEPMDHGKIVTALPAIKKALSDQNWALGAETIMTTDTFPKASSCTAKIGDTEVTISGIAKGSGMIAPDMATMLGYVFTDAKIPSPILQKLLSGLNNKTFNSITVDGDTSTSDTVLLAATGQSAAHAEIVSENDTALIDFKEKLHNVLQDLAHQIIKDGEGATKFVAITVSGAEHDAAAQKIGFAIANSPLVKTAIAASDANWGRIVMAVGKAGEKADRDKLCIQIGGIDVAKDGQAMPDFDEAPVAKHMQNDEIDITVDLQIGTGRATVWTCDLTHGYIDINADYRRT